MSQPIYTKTESTHEWGIMILLDLVGSTPQGLMGSDEELREYQRRRIEHVTSCAQKHGIERLDDQGDADLLFLPGDQPQPLLELFHDLNRRNPVPNYRHFQPVLRMVAHYNKFAFSPRDGHGLRKQLSSNHLTLQFRFEKACPQRALLMTRGLYELVRDHVPADWPQYRKPVPPKLEEWLTITSREIYWLALPGEELHEKVEAAYAKLCDEAQVSKSSNPDPRKNPVADVVEHRSKLSRMGNVLLPFVNHVLTFLVLAAFSYTLWQGVNGNWNASALIPITLGVKGFWILLDWPNEIRALAIAALFAIVIGSVILLGNLKAKKQWHDGTGMWIIGVATFAFGLGMATVLAMAQSPKPHGNSAQSKKGQKRK